MVAGQHLLWKLLFQIKERSTDVIATWKDHHGDECKTYDFFIKQSKGGKRKLSSKGQGCPSKLSKTSP